MHISMGIWVSPAIILTLVILIWGYIKHAWAYTFAVTLLYLKMA
jgi:hypothetical protein